MTFTIGILATGRLLSTLSDVYGPYGRLLEQLIDSADPHFSYRNYAVIDGVLPSRPDECDGWLITGSRHGVYERLSWMAPLEEFLRQVVAVPVPVVGICFGHQILATALGGRVEKSTKGWGVGPTTYELARHKPWMVGSPLSDTFTINAMHQDQVVELPPDAEVFASSAFCPYAGLSYHDRAISFQAHPEFNNEFERSLILNREGVIPEDRTGPALEALEAPEAEQRSDAARVGQWIATFFKDFSNNTAQSTPQRAF